MSRPELTFSEWVEALRKRVEPREAAASETWWDANTHSDESTEARAAQAQKSLARIYADTGAFAELQAFAAVDLTPDESRQITLLRNAFLANQMNDATIDRIVDTERRVESTYNTFRAPLRDEPTAENALREILRTSDDAVLRRDAWEAAKAIGPIVEPDVRTLVAIRNAEAQRHGYADFYQFSLALQEIEPDALFAILEAVEAATETPFRACKAALDASLAERFGIAVSDLRAHHYGDPFFQEAPTGDIDLDRFFAGKDLPALTTTFFDAIGLDTRAIFTRSDLYERPGKSQHAFCLHVGRYEDVRVLCNCTPTEQWMGTLLHELGHAVYDANQGDDLPFFLRDVAHVLTTEAIAMLMGRFSRNAAWLSRYAGVGTTEAQAVATSAAREQAAQLSIFTRWCLVMAHFERALYSDPTQDLNALWWTLVQRFQHILPPDGRDSRPDWAAKLHLALTPVYYHNYLLGEMFASQLLHHLRTVVVSDDAELVSSPAVGEYLRTEIFNPGARLRWDALILAATGEGLHPGYFVAELG